MIRATYDLSQLALCNVALWALDGIHAALSIPIRHLPESKPPEPIDERSSRVPDRKAQRRKSEKAKRVRA